MCHLSQTCAIRQTNIFLPFSQGLPMNTTTPEVHPEAAPEINPWLCTPRGWQRPEWWTDELDEISATARYFVRTGAQARQMLYRHRNPEKVKAQRAAAGAQRQKRGAPERVQHFTVAIPALEARVAELNYALKHGCAHAKKPDGKPFVWFFDIERELWSINNNLTKARKGLARWTKILADSANANGA
jgi:hypothetical protein